MRNFLLTIVAIAVFAFAASDAQAQSFGFSKGRSSFSNGFGGSYYGGRSFSSNRGFSSNGFSSRSSFGNPYYSRSYSPYRSYYRGGGGKSRAIIVY